MRYLRAQNKDVAFICGSDEHGVAISIRAKKEGVTPKDIIDKYDTMIKTSFEQLGISFDNYSRTSSKIHHQTAQEFFKDLNSKNIFLEKESEQLYDEAENQFLADRFITGTCPKCKSPDSYGDQCENCGTSHNASDLINPKSAITGLIPEMKNKIPEDLLMIKIDDRSFSPYLKPATLFDGGSGLVSSAEDYLKFAQMLLNGGELAGERVLSRKSVELMSSNLLPDRIKGSDDYIPGAGFGITVGVIEDPALLGQYGSKGMYFWGGAAATFFWVDPKEELVAVVMTQLLASPWPMRETFLSLIHI